jgi:multidrug efflux pump subunit AcrA (membrane-fusion protein)
VVVLVLIGIVAGGVWGASQILGKRAQEKVSSTLTAAVERGDLVVTVVEDGNLESASNIDIKCEVAGGSSILWIVEDGTEVKEGDKIVELDSSALEESINQQRITFEKARAAKIQAEKNYEAAKLAVDEYLQGTFVQAVQDQDAQITIAEENLRSAQNALEHSQRMFRKGYISSLDLESQKFSVQRAQLELDSARTAKDVLVKFTKEKMLQELESARDSAEAQMRSEGASFDLEKSRLERLESQMEKCLIDAPASGMVVYANDQGSRFGGSQSPSIEEGAAVRERQTILRLPDLAQMQVKVNVHESKIEMLGQAMRDASARGEVVRARIRILDRELQGTLDSIANQPEPSGWWTGNIKEYATIIKIDGTPQGLRPGMTAECEILVDHLKDVLTIPVAAVVEQRGKYKVWITVEDGFQERPLVLGATNDQFVEVQDGVVEGANVVLNPRAVIPEARAIKEAVEEMDVAEKFGKERKRPAGAKSPAGPAAGDEKKSGETGGPEKGAGKRQSMSLSELDKDGDGKVSKEELPASAQPYFDMIDGDSDGFIDSSEFAQMRQRAAQRGGGGAPGGTGGGSGGGPPR